MSNKMIFMQDGAEMFVKVVYSIAEIREVNNTL